MSVTVLHHPDAGTKSWSAERFLRELNRAGFSATYASLDEPGWEDALARTRELAIVAGGDGTVAKVMRAVDPAVPLAILPTGSANNIAQCLGVSGRPEDLIRSLPGAAARSFRVGTAQGCWGVRTFVEALGLGALTRSVARLQHAKLDGDHKLESGRAAFRDAVAGMTPIRGTALADDTPIDEPLLLVEVMNIPMIGPNLRLCPDVDMGDDTLSVVYLPERDRDAMLAWLDDPEPSGTAPVRRLRCRTARFEARDEPLRFDDKTTEWDGSPVVLRTAPQLLTVLVPGGADERTG